MLAAVALTNIWLLWGEKNYKQYMMLKRADKEYSQAIMSGSIVELEQFVNDCPAKYQKDARTILEKRAWADDTVAWETAQRRNTKEAYQTYLDLYCDNGTHTKEAIDLITRKLSQNCTNRLGELYYVGGVDSLSSICVTNNTCHKMKVFFSGRDSGGYMVLDSGTKETVNLINGHYEVVATIDAPSTTPWSDTYDLTGGNYYFDLSWLEFPRFCL